MYLFSELLTKKSMSQVKCHSLVLLVLFCIPVQENVAQMLLMPHPSNLPTSQNMKDPELLQEEQEEGEDEEFIVLDAEHVCSLNCDIYAISMFA